MTKKVDFRQLMLKDIEGNELPVDISKNLGNMMYMQGQTIDECELGRDIYHKGEVELKEKDIDVVKRFANNFSFIMRQTILDAIEDKD